jgi:hypothetical protein
MLKQSSELYGFATMLASQDYDELFSFGKYEKKDFDEKFRQFTNPFQILFDMLKNDFDECKGISLRYKELESLKIERDTIISILGDINEWCVEEPKAGRTVRTIHEKISNYNSLAVVMNRVLEQRNIGLSFEKFCRCISRLVSCRNVNQHLKEIKDNNITDTKRKQDEEAIWWTYEQLFNEPKLRKYLPHFVASLYFALGMKNKISYNDDIESLVQLWNEFPNYAELNEENSITKIMDGLSGRSWGYKEQYIDSQGRLKNLISGLKTSSVVTIWGEGGIGKTELVYQALKEIDSNNKLGVKFSNILPFSFKSNLQGEYDDETGGTKSVERIIWSRQPEFHDVIKSLAEASGEWKDLANKDEMNSSALEYLLNNAIIVIIDNTEVIEESEFNYQLQNFISSFVEGSNFETKSRIIITSRVSPGDRHGAHIKMKYLNLEEMTELAIVRANWLYSNFANGRVPDVNLTFHYDGWESLTDYVNSELSRPEKELVGHPLFVFLCVRELMYNNPNKLQFHEVIMKLINVNSPSSKISNLFKYITERSIASINELSEWSTTLIDMIDMEIFSEKQIKESIGKHNGNYNSTDIIGRLLELDIIRILPEEEFENYQFKSEFYAAEMRSKIESLPEYEGKNKKVAKILEQYRVLTTYISERPVTNPAYIILPSRFDLLNNRSIKSFNREWIEVIYKLATASHDLIIDIENSDSIISFMDTQRYKEKLIESLNKYLNCCSKKLCDNFVINPRTNEFKELMKLLTKLEQMRDLRFCETRKIIFSELSANISRVYSVGIHPESLSLIHYLERNLESEDNLSQFPVNIVKLINTMLGKCDTVMERKLFDILSAINIHEDNNRTEILKHCNVICRTLSKSPEYVGLLLETTPTFFEQMSNRDNIQISNLRKFDIFEITPTDNLVVGNSITFTKNETEYIIVKPPSILIANCIITCQVFWIGLNDSASSRIYALYLNHEESISPINELVSNLEVNNAASPIDILSKDDMFKLLQQIVIDARTNVSKLFGETLAAKLREEDYDFSWSQWKISAYPNPKEQKITHIISDLSNNEWRVPRLSAGGFNLHIITSPDSLISNEKIVRPIKPRAKNLSEKTAELRQSLRAKKFQREEE